MRYIPYQKPFQTPKQILDKLISNGLIVENSDFAIQILKKINYFRLKIYLRPYKDKYYNLQHNDFKDMPPFWIVSELATFGNILSIFESLDKAPFRLEQNKNSLDELSKKFGAKNLKELNSWLKLIRDVRNRVAHHSRVWNCNYREPNGIRQLLGSIYQPVKQNKIYLLFVILEILYQKKLVSKSTQKLVCKLIEKYPTAYSYMYSMGIPEEWVSE